jgi:hypothetical protein
MPYTVVRASGHPIHERRGISTRSSSYACDGLVRMTSDLELRNYHEALVPEDRIAGEGGTPLRPFPPHALALIVPSIEPDFAPGNIVVNKCECLPQFRPITGDDHKMARHWVLLRQDRREEATGPASKLRETLRHSAHWGKDKRTGRRTRRPA